MTGRPPLIPEIPGRLAKRRKRLLRSIELQKLQGRPAYRPILGGRRQRSMLSHDFGRDQLDDKRNAKWDEEQVVHIANDRDEIRKQINWRRRVSRDSNGKRLRIQGTRGSWAAR